MNNDIKVTVKKHLNLLKEQKEIKGWGDSKQKLSKEFQFKDFNGAMQFVNKIASIAEKQNHHPDITVNYNKVKLTISDHEKGRVSEKCIKFVKEVDKL